MANNAAYQPSDLAEDAIRDIATTLHDFHLAYDNSKSIFSIGRFSGQGTGLHDRASQLALANIVAIVEFFAERTLLAAGCDPKKIKSWATKPIEWKKIFGADIADPEVSPSFMPMRGYYEARNAIMHRHGELTDSQRKREVFDRLDAANIERVGFIVVVTPRTAEACGDVCRNCIEELDSTVVHRP